MITDCHRFYLTYTTNKVKKAHWNPSRLWLSPLTFVR